jgi:cinnamyl-alcohol dehydrogenase
MMFDCFMVNQSTMSSLSGNDECLGWAARDESGVLSPYNFSRRYV